MGSAMCIVQGWGCITLGVVTEKMLCTACLLPCWGLSAFPQDACITASEGHLAWALRVELLFRLN